MWSAWYGNMPSTAEVMVTNADISLPSEGGDTGNSIQLENGSAQENTQVCGNTWERHPLRLEGPKIAF